MIRTMRPRSRAQRRNPSRILESLEPRLAPAVFTVNSFADILSPPAGTVTLRSAIQAANTTPGPTRSTCPFAGTYKITTVGTATDNSAGEFAIADAGDLTIQNTSGGTVTIDGGGLNRVFDVDPAASAMPFTRHLPGPGHHRRPRRPRRRRRASRSTARPSVILDRLQRRRQLSLQAPMAAASRWSPAAPGR